SAANDFCRPSAKTHAAPFFANLALLIEQADDRLSGFLIELAAIGSGDASYVSRELNCRHPHPETQTEKGDIIFAGILGGADFSLDAAFAKASGNQNTGDVSELTVNAMLERFSIDQA